MCLFTCAATRAVHIDIALDLTADTIKKIIGSFTARGSTPKVIWSDNATNFKLGSDFLRVIIENSKVQQTFEDLECEWKFIPPRAPWFGKFYERFIGTI